MIGTLRAPNLTPGGVGGTYTDTDWIRALRHGVAPDGTPLVFMPSWEYYYLSKEDLGALIAYLKQLRQSTGRWQSLSWGQWDGP